MEKHGMGLEIQDRNFINTFDMIAKNVSIMNFHTSTISTIMDDITTLQTSVGNVDRSEEEQPVVENESWSNRVFTRLGNYDYHSTFEKVVEAMKSDRCYRNIFALCFSIQMLLHSCFMFGNIQFFLWYCFLAGMLWLGNKVLRDVVFVNAGLFILWLRRNARFSKKTRKKVKKLWGSVWKFLYILFLVALFYNLDFPWVLIPGVLWIAF